MNTAILVCGSRALDSVGEAKSSAIDLLEDHVPGHDMLWHGGCANSPDVWADVIASRHAMGRTIYYSCGKLVYRNCDYVSNERWADSNNNPLLRNKMMVSEFAKEHPHGEVLALVAGWSKTQGTMHTARLARMAGLSVTVMTAERFRDGKIKWRQT